MEYIPTNKGVRQACPLSPTLFNIYTDEIFWLQIANIDLGISLQRNKHVNSLLYTDDSVINRENTRPIQKAIFIFNILLQDYGIKISAPKS